MATAGGQEDLLELKKELVELKTDLDFWEEKEDSLIATFEVWKERLNITEEQKDAYLRKKDRKKEKERRRKTEVDIEADIFNVADEESQTGGFDFSDIEDPVLTNYEEEIKNIQEKLTTTNNELIKARLNLKEIRSELEITQRKIRVLEQVQQVVSKTSTPEKQVELPKAFTTRKPTPIQTAQIPTPKRKASETGAIKERVTKRGKTDVEQPIAEESQDFPPVRQAEQNIPLQISTPKRKASETGAIKERSTKRGKINVEQAIADESQDFPPVRQAEQNVPLVQSLGKGSIDLTRAQLRKFTHPTINTYPTAAMWWGTLDSYIKIMTSPNINQPLQLLTGEYLNILLKLKHHLADRVPFVENEDLSGFYRVVSYITEYYRKENQPNLTDQQMNEIWSKQVLRQPSTNIPKIPKKPTKGIKIIFYKTHFTSFKP